MQTLTWTQLLSTAVALFALVVSLVTSGRSIRSSQAVAEQNREATKQIARDNIRNHHEDQVTDAAVELVGGISDELRIMGQVRAKLEILPRGNAAESRRVYEECEALLHERSRITTLAITRIHLVIPKNLQAEAKSLERSINGHREEFIKYFGSFQGRNSDRLEFPEMDQAYKDRLNGFVVLIRGYRETTRDLVGKTAVPTNDQMRQKGVSY